MAQSKWVVWVWAAGLMMVAGCAVRTDRSADVVVYGATPAGILAAVAAAKDGHRVVLALDGTHIGGMVSAGLSATDYWGSGYIAGPTADFFKRLGAHYGTQVPAWAHEPGVAENAFSKLLSEHPGIEVVTGAVLRTADVEDKRIQAIHTDAGTFRAPVFIDATYEGDLLAAAGGSYAVGRESRQKYRESLAGVVRDKKGACAYCLRPIDPFVTGGKVPLPLLEAGGEPAGSGDARVMNYNFRLCLTDRPANRVPFPEPRNYDPARFEFFSRAAAQLPHASVKDQVKSSRTYAPRRQVRSAYFNLTALPSGKYDMNSGSVFLLQLPGGSLAWPEADPEDRARIFDAHKEYTLQFLRWIRTDPGVSSKVRDYLSKMGLCADEWKETEHWPPLLYVREARRMVADHVVVQPDIEGKRQYVDSVLAAFAPFDAKSVRLELSHDGQVFKEGTIYKGTAPFEIPYRAIRPRESEVTNLVVPVAVSASHVAYSAIRMEPILMGLGTAAGHAAALAVEGGTSVQDVEVAALQARLKSSGQIFRL